MMPHYVSQTSSSNPKGNLESPNAQNMSLVCGRKPEYPHGGGGGHAYSTHHAAH